MVMRCNVHTLTVTDMRLMHVSDGESVLYEYNQLFVLVFDGGLEHFPRARHVFAAMIPTDSRSVEMF